MNWDAEVRRAGRGLQLAYGSWHDPFVVVNKPPGTALNLSLSLSLCLMVR
jgi:hypothetical protein